MCDYSLEHYRSRPAQKGEEYETNRFPSGSVGFTVPGDQSVAVCMMYDTRLRLEKIPTMTCVRLGVNASETVSFARVEHGAYRDGIRFDNGQVMSLQELGPGVRAWLEDALMEPLPQFSKPAARVEETV